MNPLGSTSMSTMRTPPKITRDSSALTSEDHSGTNTMNSEPSTGPRIDAAPPITRAARNSIERLIVYCAGSTRLSTAVLVTKSEPPRPASMALMPKVTTL